MGLYEEVGISCYNAPVFVLQIPHFLFLTNLPQEPLAVKTTFRSPLLDEIKSIQRK